MATTNHQSVVEFLSAASQGMTALATAEPPGPLKTLMILTLADIKQGLKRATIVLRERADLDQAAL